MTWNRPCGKRLYDLVFLCSKGLYDPVFPCDKGLYDPVFPILDIKNTLYALPFIFIVPTTILRKLNLEVEVNQRYSKKFVDFSKAKKSIKWEVFVNCTGILILLFVKFSVNRWGRSTNVSVSGCDLELEINYFTMKYIALRRENLNLDLRRENASTTIQWKDMCYSRGQPMPL